MSSDLIPCSVGLLEAHSLQKGRMPWEKAQWDAKPSVLVVGAQAFSILASRLDLHPSDRMTQSLLRSVGQMQT